MSITTSVQYISEDVNGAAVLMIVNLGGLQNFVRDMAITTQCAFRLGKVAQNVSILTSLN